MKKYVLALFLITSLQLSASEGYFEPLSPFASLTQEARNKGFLPFVIKDDNISNLQLFLISCPKNRLYSWVPIRVASGRGSTILNFVNTILVLGWDAAWPERLMEHGPISYSLQKLRDQNIWSWREYTKPSPYIKFDKNRLLARRPMSSAMFTIGDSDKRIGEAGAQLYFYNLIKQSYLPQISAKYLNDILEQYSEQFRDSGLSSARYNRFDDCRFKEFSLKEAMSSPEVDPILKTYLQELSAKSAEFMAAIKGQAPYIYEQKSFEKSAHGFVGKAAEAAKKMSAEEKLHMSQLAERFVTPFATAPSAEERVTSTDEDVLLRALPEQPDTGDTGDTPEILEQKIRACLAK